MQIKAKNIREALSTVYEGFANYPVIAITDDDGTLCEECIKANYYEIETSFPGNGWHVIALEFAEESCSCNHCSREIVESDDDEPLQ